MKIIVFPFTQEAHSESLAVMKGKSTSNQKDEGCGVFHHEGRRRWRRGGAGLSEEKPSVSNLPGCLENILWNLPIINAGYMGKGRRYKKG